MALASTSGNRINVSELAAAEPAAILRPSSVDDVKMIVRSHGAVRGEGTLRVVSSGFNWGLGSASGPVPDQTLLDLSGLSAIRTVDVERGFAVVEAGVTQQQLCAALAGSGRFLNCTASSPYTSVVGNMMDRGVGLRCQRTEDLFGLEVVTAAGEVGSVGWWPPTSGLAPNRYGLGPSSVQLFPQSTLGIATAGVVRLLPTPEVTTVLTFTVPEAGYDELIETLRGLVRDRLTDAVVKVYDADSSDLYGGLPTITGHVSLDGSAAVVAAKQSEVTARLAAIGAGILSDAQLAEDPLAVAVADLYRGDVSRSESIVQASLGAPTHEADELGRGWIFVLPFVPFTVRDLRQARAVVQSIPAEHGVKVGTTVNALGYDVVDLVIAIRFDRTSADATGAAHHALDLLYRDLTRAGYPPYRLDTSHRRSDVLPDPDLNALIATHLKEALDPAGLLGPSRYLA